MINLKNRKIEDVGALRNIGTQIRQYRKVHHITQVQLSKSAGIPQASIVRIEHGKNTGTLTLAKLAAVMDLNIKLNVSK